MQQLKFWTVATIVWLCTFFTIERLHEPMNIASFVYVMTAVLSVAILLFERMTHQIQLGLLVLSLGLLLGLKWLLGYPSLGAAIPITVTEATALGLTIYLSGRVHRSVEDFQQAALAIAGASELGRATDFDEGQVDIYRELRLARTYNRPLSLMTITPQLDGNERLLDGLVEEIYRRSSRQYIHGQIAELLLHATDGCATVVGRNDHLVVSLPEVDVDHAEEMLNRIRQVVRDQLGIEVDAGFATFPDEELTLRGLLDRAEETMRTQDRNSMTDIRDDKAFVELATECGS